MRGLGAFWALASAAMMPSPPRAEEPIEPYAPQPDPWERLSVDAEDCDYKSRSTLPTHGPSAKTLRRRAKLAAKAKTPQEPA